jgi:hypothetical protein
MNMDSTFGAVAFKKSDGGSGQNLKAWSAHAFQIWHSKVQAEEKSIRHRSKGSQYFYGK